LDLEIRSVQPEVRLLDANAPLHQRLGGYLAERFPPVVYTVLVALFFGSAVLLAQAQDPGSPLRPHAWLGGVIIWLAFLHLRLMDEAKDFEADWAAYPNRLLSRGVVSLKLLGRLLIAVVLAEVALAWWLGPEVLMSWGAMFIFTLAMRMEFGISGWLSRHIVVYAITHNPVVALLALFAHACTGLQWSANFLFYVGLVSLGSLAFEVGRKIREPQEEIPGVASYSSALGRTGAAWLLSVVVFLTIGAGVLTLWPLAQGPTGAVAMGILWLGGLAAVMFARPGQPSKRVELGASLLLLLSFVSVGVAAW
jgi:hypothetical protein